MPHTRKIPSEHYKTVSPSHNLLHRWPSSSASWDCCASSTVLPPSPQIWCSSSYSRYLCLSLAASREHSGTLYSALQSKGGMWPLRRALVRDLAFHEPLFRF